MDLFLSQLDFHLYTPKAEMLSLEITILLIAILLNKKV